MPTKDNSPDKQPAPDGFSRKLKNLQRGTPFPKGVSGNPAGRPKGSENRATKLSRAYDQWLQEMVADGTMTRAEAVAHRMGHIALTGKPGAAVQAAKELGDRSEGKPAMSVQVSQVMDEDTARRILEVSERWLSWKKKQADELPESHRPGCLCERCAELRRGRELDAQRQERNKLLPATPDPVPQIELPKLSSGGISGPTTVVTFNGQGERTK